MTENKHSTAPGWIDPDDAPDLSAPEWAAKVDAAPVKRGGRPKSAAPKVSTTIRLDADILERFRSEGDGWQSRINAVLREWVTSH